MSWQPTVGTLSDEQLAGTWQDLGVGYYLDDPAQTRRAKDRINEHIAALTAQLERARGIAVALEQELAQRGAGTWPMRQYATVELPDDAADKAGVE